MKSTYFTFQGRYYEQLEEAAIGSPISPIVANLYMEYFEVKAINTSPHTPSLWKCYVDDTFTVIRSAHKRSFLYHINSLDQNIQFTSEDSRIDGSMPFLDILVTPKQDGSLNTTVHRKPTHTDLYLQWDSHHTISSKYSVVGTLHHGSKTICSSPQLLQQEKNNYLKHLQNASTVHGLSSGWGSRPMPQPRKTTEEVPTILDTTTARTLTWWFPTTNG